MFPYMLRVDRFEQTGASTMQMTLKQFRHLAQGMQSIVTSVAVISLAALAWEAFKTYREAQQAPVKTGSED